jgi:hemerythrin-like domain-containing protein
VVAVVIDPVAAWHKEHEHFRRLLRLVREQLDVFQAGGEPDYALMRDIVSYLREYSDQVHHPREDAAFDRLLRHCPDLELVLARLHQEHRVIEHAGAALSAAIDAVLEDAIVPREQVEAAAATYLTYYENHLHTEESAVLPRAAQHLGDADWAAVQAAVPHLADPLFGSPAPERLRTLRRRLGRV